MMTPEQKAELKAECLKLLPQAVDEMAKSLRFVAIQRQECEQALAEQIDQLLESGTDPELIKKNLEMIAQRFNSGVPTKEVSDVEAIYLATRFS